MEIIVKNINKSYGNHQVLKDISFTVESGTECYIIGHSGSGKTTLLNIIGHVDTMDNGIVLCDGVKLNNNRAKRDFLRNKVSFILQDYGLMLDKTVLENFEVLYALRKMKFKEKQKQVLEALSQVGIPDILDKKVYELSGGEQQRVSIAKVIIKMVYRKESR